MLFGRLGLQFFEFSIYVSSQFSLLGQGYEFKTILEISADLGTILQIRALKSCHRVCKLARYLPEDPRAKGPFINHVTQSRVSGDIPGLF